MQMTLKLPRPHNGRSFGGQKRILRESRRYNVLDCGRRFGKTDLCEIIIHKPLLAGLPVGWFAPKYKTLDDAWQEIKRIYAPLIVQKSDTEKKITLRTGGILEGWTLDNEGAGRSRKYAMVVIDEAAQVDQLMDKFTFDIMPTLMDYRGSAWFPSTPKGLNDFHKLWQKSADEPEWKRWQMSTYENPYIDTAEIDAMRELMPDRVFRQEIMAEFLENGSFFQGVDGCCTIAEKDTPESHAGHRFVAGLDWALSEDFTVLTVLCATCGRAVDWWRANRMDFTAQRGQITARLALWPNVVLLPERNSIGAPNIEMLAQAGLQIAAGPDGGLGFATTSSTKAELINRLALAIERGEVKLPTEYADELRAYEVTLTTGNPKFSAPSGQHDDRVISSALAWWCAVSGITRWHVDPSGHVDDYQTRWS